MNVTSPLHSHRAITWCPHRRLAVVAALAVLASVIVPLLTPQSAAAEPDTGKPGVVLVGVAGLAWSDVTAEDTPTLYELTKSSGAASLTVRTVRSRTCVVDGWLTVNAGKRSTDIYDPEGPGDGTGFCRRPPDPVSDESGSVKIPGWDDLRQTQEEQSYGSKLGLVGDRLHEIGACGTAIGPGAAIALADSEGRVNSYHKRTDKISRELLAECPVTVVDMGGLPFDAPSPIEDSREEATSQTRRDAARVIDNQLKDLITNLPDESSLLVVGVSDSAPTTQIGLALPHVTPALRAALARDPVKGESYYGAEWLTASTHWTGLVQLTDVAATLLGHAGVNEPSEGTVGRAWRPDGAHPASVKETLAELVGLHRATEIYRTQSGPLFQVLGAIQVVLFLGALVVHRWRRVRPTLLRVVYVGALFAASVPVASYLSNLLTWWKFAYADVVLWGAIMGFAAILTLVAALGPWRRRIYGPPGVVAGVTATVMAVDVSTGSTLQQSSLLGLSPLVAGRFYGFGNIPFAIFVISCLVAAAALGQWLRDRGHSRRVVAAAVAAVGILAVVIDGAPQAGADVGGILAAIPGFALLVLGAYGARITFWRLAIAGAVAAGLFLLLAWLDWLRPVQEQTHFGEFFGDLIQGDALTVMLRKLSAAIGTLGKQSVYGLLVPVAYVIIIWLMRSSSQFRYVHATAQRWSLLRHLVWAGLLTGAVGFAVNDSGIIIPALLLTVGIPLVVSAVASAASTEQSVQPRS